MERYVIGLDNGGTSTKAAIFDLTGKEIATAGRSTKVITPKSGYTERDMEELWLANCDCIKRAIEKAGINGEDVLGIAVCGHGKGLYPWGKDGKPVANPKASEDSLTAQPIAPQAEAIANAIRDIKPDVLITYDLDGGYGHPDHVRTHQAVLEALKILGDSNDRPILTWGIEGEFSEQDARQQCAITGSVEAKREAMKAHGTQIVVTGDTTFEFSNKVEQKISAVETYRLLDGNAQRKIPETPTQAGIVSLLITCILLGILAGIAGSIYHAWVMYTGETPLPVGLVFGFATVFFASLWASLALRRGGATVITGAFAFLVIYALAFMRPDSPFVLVNPDYPPIGLYGTLWLLGTPVISLLAFFVFTRTKEGNAFYNTPRQVHLRHRRAEEKARRAQTLNNSSHTAP